MRSFDFPLIFLIEIAISMGKMRGKLNDLTKEFTKGGKGRSQTMFTRVVGGWVVKNFLSTFIL